MPDSLPDSTANLAAQVEINALVAAYSDAVNRRNAEDWAACWADDAVWRLRTMELTGKEQIVSGWRKAMESYAQVWFIAFAGHIALESGGNSAQVRSHTFEYLCPVGGAPKLQSGLYEDRVIRQNGRWVFASRTFSSQELPL